MNIGGKEGSKYGIYVSSNSENVVIGKEDENSVLTINNIIGTDETEGIGVYIDTNSVVTINSEVKINTNTVGIYAAGNSSVTINGEITGANNKVFLEAAGGTIDMAKALNISANETGLYAKEKGLINLNTETATIRNSTTAIEIAGGSVISAGTINLIDNEIGVLFYLTGLRVPNWNGVFLPSLHTRLWLIIW